MKGTHHSDEWLMGRVVQGQRDCLEVLVRRHATPLLTYMARMIGDQQRGEDLVQEVFLAVWIKRKTYKVNKPFKAWLYAIATNRFRSVFRSRKGKEMAWLEGYPDAWPVIDSPSPAEAALGRERASMVNAAIAQLPERHRMVVTLRVWGGLSYAEIAEVAGRTETTVRSHMHRALASLRKHLAPAIANE